MTKSKKKLLTYASLAMLGAGALTGCGNKENTTSNDNVVKAETINTESENTALLQGTLLDGTVVADIDGDIQIVKTMYDDGGFFGKPHYDFFNITNSTTYRNIHCVQNAFDSIYYSSFAIKGEITNYLTEEELKKAINNQLTEDDVAAIVFRVNQEEQKKLELK